MSTLIRGFHNIHDIVELVTLGQFLMAPSPFVRWQTERGGVEPALLSEAPAGQPLDRETGVMVHGGERDHSPTATGRSEFDRAMHDLGDVRGKYERRLRDIRKGKPTRAASSPSSSPASSATGFWTAGSTPASSRGTKKFGGTPRKRGRKPTTEAGQPTASA
jgi:hypothetical protein